MRASSELQFGALREGGGTREAGSGRGEPDSALSGGYAPDSTKARRAARSSTSRGRDGIPVRENHRLEPGGF